MNTGQRYDITIAQGAPFYMEATALVSGGSTLNLSGCSGFAGIKYRYDATGTPTYFSFGIVSAESGIYSLALTTGQTSALNCTQARYETEITGAGFVLAKQRFGLANIYPQIVSWA